MSDKETTAVKGEEQENFTKKHQTVWQFIKFILFSQLAGLTEIVSFAILGGILPEKMPEDFDFFVFHYTNSQGLCKGAFIAFFVSAVLAEIVSFLLNRKATFNANNNVLVSAIEYAVLVLGVICLKTWLITVLTPLISSITDIQLLVEWIPKLASMVVAVLIIFPMNKFVIMRHTEKEEKEEK